MAEKSKVPNPDHACGIEFHCSDGQDPKPPNHYELDGTTSQDWFEKFPALGNGINYKILSLRIDRQGDLHEPFRVPFNAETVEHAFWKPELYYNFSKSAAGGASALLDDPPRFLIQTPRDGGPFFSLAMNKSGFTAKGVYVYDHEDFEPVSIAKNETSISGWRQTGLQVISFPTALLRAHSMYISRNLTDIVRDIEKVESALAATSTVDFRALSLSLHFCSTRLINLERRSRFEQSTIEAIEATVGKCIQATNLPWTRIAPEQSAIAARAFDFESLPRRIQNARATIASLIQHHNEMMNLEIADASRRMAEIAVSDNASMKTIAIMTMIFLPGTAVASFFSIDMFNWDATEGSQIADSYIWVYFVVAIPLTGLVVAIWWLWAKHTARQRAQPNFFGEDLELLDHHSGSSQNPDLVSTGPNK